MNKKVIVTITVGTKHKELWNRFSRESWEKYSEKYGYDLVVFSEPLDRSKRASDRSVAWQKCLILKQPEVQGYERVLWLDSDIIVNYFTAPCIVSKVEQEKVGAVNAWDFRGEDFFKLLHYRSKLYELRHDFLSYNIGYEYFSDYGLSPISQKAVQSGVMVLTPKYHQETLEQVYNDYEDGRTANWHYEMRPLSYEFIKAGMVQWLDYRFNYVVENLKAERYSHKYPKNYFERAFRVSKILTFPLVNRLGVRVWQQNMVNTAFTEGYFIHFAGNSKEMIFSENLLKI